MKHLTTEEIILIHNKLIKEFGGEEGIVDRDKLDFIADKVQSSKADVFRKAAMLLHDIATIHPFVDGNKRTAIETAKVFLRENGKTLNLKDINQAAEYIYSVAEDKKNIFSIENWIKQHCD